MRFQKKSIVFAIVFLWTNLICAQPDGRLDSAFNQTGLITFASENSTFKSVAVQADGKIVAVGFANEKDKNTFLVARYTADGALDSSFGHNGIVTTRFGMNESASGAHAVALQDDGKIVVGGFTDAVRHTSKFCLARYNCDGSLDTSFFGGRAILRGTVITTFGGGQDLSQLNGLTIAPDGKIVAAGFCLSDGAAFAALARYNGNGSLDTSFNARGAGSIPGTVRTHFGIAPVIQDEASAVALAPGWCHCDRGIIVLHRY